MPPILTPDQRLRVFVSSTLQELAPERAAARTAITALRLTPVLFELGARPHPPRALYRAYLEQSHIFVGIYWQRYGWVAPGEEISGLEDEYRLSGARPKLIYVKTPAPEREARLKALLSRIQNDDQASYKPFGSARELRRLLEDDLALLLTERFAATLTPPTSDPAPAAAPTAPTPPPLPQPPTPLIGRERELAELERLLGDPAVRLVTLLGPGGVGKSRLALEAAHRLREGYPDGAVFVALAHVTDPDLLLPSIAAALGVHEDGERPLAAALAGHLRSRRMLLLLDNFEQLEPAAPSLWDLLAAAAGPTVLVTSRAALRLTAERALEVAPLELPARADPPLEAIRAADAVRLFVERARAAKPGFELTPENAPAVAEITRRLDGLPLALELAAARVPLLPPQALLRRLDRRFEMLASGARDLPERQRTLWNAIDWSHALLPEAERALFARLGIFVSGWALEAAEAVCGAGDAAGAPLLDGLGSLVAKSLVAQRDAGGEARFSMLESIRAYALAKLAERGEEGALRERHLEYFTALAEGLAPDLLGAEQAAHLTRLELEHPDLRAALDAAAAREDATLELRLAAALWRFWYARGHLSEGRARLAAALARAADPPAARAMALQGAGVLADAQGDYAAARPLLERALALRRELGDRTGVSASLNSLGLVAAELGDYAAAEPLLREALELRRELGDAWGIAASLVNLGKLTFDRGDFEAAQALFDESLARFEALGDDTRVAVVLANLGSLAHVRDDHLGARALHERSLALWRKLDDDWGVALSILNLGDAANGLGETAAARERYLESLAMFRSLADRRSMTDALEKLAGLEAVPERAARLWGAAERGREELGSPLRDYERADHERRVAEVRARLGEAAFGAAWRAGRRLELDEAVELALEASGGGPPAESVGHAGGLRSRPA